MARGDGRCPVRVRVDQGESTKHLPRTQNGDDRLVALRSQHPNRDPTGGQQMQRVGWITMVEDRLPFSEATMPPCPKQLIAIFH
jgi:hypothetical protein